MVSTKTVILNLAEYALRALIVGELKKNTPCIVMLHGGLDCIETWKDFPVDVAKKTGLAVVAYERYGHGKSGRVTEKLRDLNYRHHEANVVLPEVLKALDIKNAILVGHSDGGAMSLIAAGGQKSILGVCAISPPLVAEEKVREGIKNALEHYENGSLAKKLAVFHGDATKALFYSWANTWLSEPFNDWSCDDDLRAITCPVSLVFGLTDEYGYQPSIDLLNQHLRVKPDVVLVKGVGHLSHHFAREKTVTCIAKLVERVNFNKRIKHEPVT